MWKLNLNLVDNLNSSVSIFSFPTMILFSLLVFGVISTRASEVSKWENRSSIDIVDDYSKANNCDPFVNSKISFLNLDKIVVRIFETNKNNISLNITELFVAKGKSAKPKSAKPKVSKPKVSKPKATKPAPNNKPNSKNQQKTTNNNKKTTTPTKSAKRVVSNNPININSVRNSRRGLNNNFIYSPSRLGAVTGAFHPHFFNRSSKHRRTSSRNHHRNQMTFTQHLERALAEMKTAQSSLKKNNIQGATSPIQGAESNLVSASKMIRSNRGIGQQNAAFNALAVAKRHQSYHKQLNRAISDIKNAKTQLRNQNIPIAKGDVTNAEKMVVAILHHK